MVDFKSIANNLHKSLPENLSLIESSLNFKTSREIRHHCESILRDIFLKTNDLHIGRILFRIMTFTDKYENLHHLLKQKELLKDQRFHKDIDFYVRRKLDLSPIANNEFGDVLLHALLEDRNWQTCRCDVIIRILQQLPSTVDTVWILKIMITSLHLQEYKDWFLILELIQHNKLSQETVTALEKMIFLRMESATMGIIPILYKCYDALGKKGKLQPMKRIFYSKIKYLDHAFADAQMNDLDVFHENRAFSVSKKFRQAKESDAPLSLTVEEVKYLIKEMKKTDSLMESCGNILVLDEIFSRCLCTPALNKIIAFFLVYEGFQMYQPFAAILAFNLAKQIIKRPGFPVTEELKRFLMRSAQTAFTFKWTFYLHEDYYAMYYYKACKGITDAVARICCPSLNVPVDFKIIQFVVGCCFNIDGISAAKTLLVPFLAQLALP
jgi:hypothetical protein